MSAPASMSGRPADNGHVRASPTEAEICRLQAYHGPDLGKRDTLRYRAATACAGSGISGCGRLEAGDCGEQNPEPGLGQRLALEPSTEHDDDLREKVNG